MSIANFTSVADLNLKRKEIKIILKKLLHFLTVKLSHKLCTLFLNLYSFDFSKNKLKGRIPNITILSYLTEKFENKNIIKIRILMHLENLKEINYNVLFTVSI